jgi:hypothetical protein
VQKVASSNLVAPTFREIKPFDEQSEGFLVVGTRVPANPAAVQLDNLEDFPLGGIIRRFPRALQVYQCSSRGGRRCPDGWTPRRLTLVCSDSISVYHLESARVAHRTSKKSSKVENKAPAKPVAAKPAKPRKTAPKSQPRKVAKPALLSGGNPQIAKADGDAPVQTYIAAMPGWKNGVGRRLDAIITRTVPRVCKAVKWNSPFYGMEGQGWFLSFHCFTKYIKVGFFRGTSLRPLPPGASKSKEMRWIDIYEGDKLDEAQFANWVKQASQIPGWGGA